MNDDDEKFRNIITDAFTQQGIDARNLAVEVIGGAVMIKGSVPTERERDLIGSILATVASGITHPHTAVTVMPAAPIDSSDGRGRSPVTGTSADSAHESRHQLDP
jgi:hypothetical protein